MKKINYSIALILIFMLICSTNVFAAATKYEGMVAYRDGVIGGEWHAGMWVAPDASYTNPIVHQAGSGYVTRVSYSGFLNANNFKGVYYKSGAATPREYLKNMALDLTTRSIAYCSFYMLEHNASSGYILQSNVKKMRCDGVVEYCYEWYSIELMWCYDGTRRAWDITYTGDCSFHNTLNSFSPTVQAGKLTKYSSSAY